MIKLVKITVRGGVAYLIHKDKGVRVEIVDYDNLPKVTEVWPSDEEEKEKGPLDHWSKP